MSNQLGTANAPQENDVLFMCGTQVLSLQINRICTEQEGFRYIYITMENESSK